MHRDLPEAPETPSPLHRNNGQVRTKRRKGCNSVKMSTAPSMLALFRARCMMEVVLFFRLCLAGCQGWHEHCIEKPNQTMARSPSRVCQGSSVSGGPRDA